MKTHQLILALSLILALFSAVSCTTEQRQQMAANAAKDALAAGTGYLIGGKAGAAAGATAQELRNIEGWQARTAAKNPGKSVQP